MLPNIVIKLIKFLLQGDKKENSTTEQTTYVNHNKDSNYVNETSDHRVLVTDNDEDNDDNETTGLLIDSSTTENRTRIENNNNENENGGGGAYINVGDGDPLAEKQYEPMMNESYINVS